MVILGIAVTVEIVNARSSIRAEKRVEGITIIVGGRRVDFVGCLCTREADWRSNERLSRKGKVNDRKRSRHSSSQREMVMKRVN